MDVELYKKNTMTTSFKLGTALTIIATTLSVSCNFCDKRPGSDLPTVDATENYNDAYPATDTLATGDAGPTAPAAGTSTSGAKRRSGSTVSNDSKIAKDDKKSEYGAKDGTDAENHDGDMYTKNNQKAMPTGTSIQ